MKFCHRCQTNKVDSDFARCSSKRTGLQSRCRTCAAEISAKDRADHPEKFRQRQRDYDTRAPWRGMLRGARQRAKKRGVSFTITMADLKAIWPADGLCPVLRVRLLRKVGRGALHTSPTLDAFIPELGYVPGNIHIISHQANAVKQDVTDPEVFERVAAWIRKLR